MAAGSWSAVGNWKICCLPLSFLLFSWLLQRRIRAFYSQADCKFKASGTKSKSQQQQQQLQNGYNMKKHRVGDSNPFSSFSAIWNSQQLSVFALHANPPVKKWIPSRRHRNYVLCQFSIGNKNETEKSLTILYTLQCVELYSWSLCALLSNV